MIIEDRVSREQANSFIFKNYIPKKVYIKRNYNNSTIIVKVIFE